MPRPTPPAPQSALDGIPGAVDVIRPIASLEEYRECVALQCEIWGDSYEPVPAALLQVSSYVGGIAAGAFAPDGHMVGFVFGLTGVNGSKIIHWSHMLGVRSTRQNAGVGRALKDYQRHELARRNIGEMYWTYDPLIAKNAHFNLNVLGARIVRYVPDMYGDTRSPLHYGLPTDRLVVAAEHLQERRTTHRLVLGKDHAHAPVLTPFPQPGDPVLTPGDTCAPFLRLEIPTDFVKVLADAPAKAKQWHTSAREHFFQWALWQRPTPFPDSGAIPRRDVRSIHSIPHPDFHDHDRRPMLCIERITIREIHLTLKEPFRISSGLMHERRIALLELTDRDGTATWSECVAGQHPNYTSETIDTAWFALREWLAPRVLGKSLSGPEALHGILNENIKGHNMAKAALEMGCWGIAATAAGVPLSQFIGGARATGSPRESPRDPEGARCASSRRAQRAVSGWAIGRSRQKNPVGPGCRLRPCGAARARVPVSSGDDGRRKLRVHAGRCESSHRTR